MDNMNNHEAYICGWVTGKLESATGMRCNISQADAYPFSTMGYMLGRAYSARKVSRELHEEIGAAMVNFDSEHAPSGAEKPLPVNQRVYWCFGHQAGSTGKPYNPDYGKNK